MLDQSATIKQFLAATAARQATPGGGAVAALSGAMAASLAEMVIQYSIGKPDLARFEAELKTILAELTRAREFLAGLMAEDQEAYAALTAARKMPAGSPGREQALAAARAASLNAPRAVAATSLAILNLCGNLVEKSNKNLLSDLAIAADLATATVRCAIYNVKVNLPDVADPQAQQAIEDENARMLVRALGLIQKISPGIWKRLPEQAP